MVLTIDQKIKYSGIIARIMIMFAVIFIGYGFVVRVMTGDPNANLIAGTGLVWGVLFLVAVYTKKNLEKEKSGGTTFFQGRP